MLPLVILSWVWLLLLCWQFHGLPLRWKEFPLPVRGMEADAAAVKIRYPKSQKLDERALGAALVLEDGRELPFRASAVAEVGGQGNGRYKFRGNEIWFSATDDTSPLTNHRAYTVRVPQLPSHALMVGSWITALGLTAACLGLRSQRAILRRSCTSVEAFLKSCLSYWRRWDGETRAATACLVLALILFARRPEGFLSPQFWAEDGTVFFLQADVLGAQALPNPHAGYLHLLLRLVAAAAAPLHAGWIPTAYMVASVVAMLGMVWALFSPRIDVPYRPALALALVLVPHSGEVMTNLTNAQWITAFYLIWLLLAQDARTAIQWISDVLVAVLVGLTGVFSILFLPIFVWRAMSRRSLASIVLAACVAAASLVQFWSVTHQYAKEPSYGLPQVAEVVCAFGWRLVAGLLLPDHLVHEIESGPALVLGIAGMSAVVAMVMAGGSWRSARYVLAACAAVMFAAGCFRLHSLREGHGLESPYILWVGSSDRYFYISKVLVLWLLAFHWAAVGWRGWASRGLCVLALSATLVDFTYPIRYTDYHWANYATRIEGGEQVNGIPINPEGFTFNHPGRAIDGAP